MAKSPSNPLFIENSRKILGREQNHIGLIKAFSKANNALTSEQSIRFGGIDFEVDNDTNLEKILGTYNEHDSYQCCEENILFNLCRWIRYACDSNITIVHWTRYDSNRIIKLFMENLTQEERNKAWKKIGKVSGKWDFKNQDWEVEPICSIKYNNDKKNFSEYGIKQTLSNSITLFYRNKYKIKTVTVVDCKALWKGNLETACRDSNIVYTKMHEGYTDKRTGKNYSVHVVDWNYYKKSVKYRLAVQKSNEEDCRAARDLAYKYNDNFKQLTGKYLTRIYSSGSMAKGALHAILSEDDYQSLNFLSILETWNTESDEATFRTVWEGVLRASEAYSGGKFTLHHVGQGDAYYADVNACYVYPLLRLPDLRGSRISIHEGSPESKKDNELLFIRGTVNIPKDLIHPFQVPNPNKLNQIIEPYGEYETSYTWEEREFGLKYGVKFCNESYVKITTTGKISPLAKAVRFFLEQRMKFRAQKSTAETTAKDAANSCYGITAQKNSVYEWDNESNDYILSSYRAGPFWNPFYAAMITATARVLICSAAMEIQKRGGKILQINTDSIHWSGKASDLPETYETPVGLSGWVSDKTPGYLSKPCLYKDFISIACGIWGGYNVEKGKFETKLRGFTIPHDGKVHYLKELLESNIDLEDGNLSLEGNKFISYKLAKILKDYGVSDIGHIEKISKYFNIISRTKGINPLDNSMHPCKDLLKGFTKIEQWCTEDFFGKEINHNVKILRGLCMEKMNTEKTPSERRKETYKKYNAKRPKRNYTIEQNEIRKLKQKIQRRQKHLKEGDGNALEITAEINTLKEHIRLIEAGK